MLQPPLHRWPSLQLGWRSQWYRAARRAAWRAVRRVARRAAHYPRLAWRVASAVEGERTVLSVRMPRRKLGQYDHRDQYLGHRAVEVTRASEAENTACASRLYSRLCPTELCRAFLECVKRPIVAISLSLLFRLSFHILVTRRVFKEITVRNEAQSSTVDYSMCVGNTVKYSMCVGMCTRSRMWIKM